MSRTVSHDVVEAVNLLAQGKRNYMCGEVGHAVNQLQEACRLLYESTFIKIICSLFIEFKLFVNTCYPLVHLLETASKVQQSSNSSYYFKYPSSVWYVRPLEISQFSHCFHLNECFSDTPSALFHGVCCQCVNIIKVIYFMWQH